MQLHFFPCICFFVSLTVSAQIDRSGSHRIGVDFDATFNMATFKPFKIHHRFKIKTHFEMRSRYNRMVSMVSLVTMMIMEFI